jgi:hypothetical protein
MLSELQQKDVWEGWLGAEIRASYFADLCSRYRLQQKIVTGLILFFSCGAAVTFVSDWLPPEWQWVKLTLALFTAGMSVLSFVQQNQKGTTDCADLHFRWNRLGDEYKALWDEMYSDDALRILRRLEEKEAELSKSSTAFPNNERLMLKWQENVQRQHNLATAA